MGSSIHAVFQKKDQNGKWVDVVSNYEEDRDYLLFSWLGNVRNTASDFHEPIAARSCNRGYPEDFEVVDDMHRLPSADFRKDTHGFFKDIDSDPKHPEHLMMFMGDHSHSWLSADEILNASLPEIVENGVISKKDYEAWDGISEPAYYSGSITGRDVEVSDPSNMTDTTTHVKVEWTVSGAERFVYFLDEVKRLKAEHGQVRMVFGFWS